MKSLYPASVRLCRNEIFLLERGATEGQRLLYNDHTACTITEIPLLLNNVDLDQCFYLSCNEQFQYESMSELEKYLMPYNQVSLIYVINSA